MESTRRVQGDTPRFVEKLREGTELTLKLLTDVMGKFGVEYNYGSKYWTPFTQDQDDSVGSKLVTRGHVGEAYYIIDVNPRMSIKLAGIYYDFEYSGSGSPVGKPKDIDDIKDGKEYSLLPVIDSAYDLNATVTVQF